MEKLLIVVVFFALNKQVTMRGEGNFIKTVQFIGKHVQCAFKNTYVCKRIPSFVCELSKLIRGDLFSAVAPSYD